MQGDEACAEGAIVAGCKLFAGYPITPSTEIAERMARRLPEVGGVFIQMEDELASIALIIGASYAGVKAMTATSGPGFSLMQENIGLAAMTEAPIVIVNVMRGGPSTGQPTRAGQGDVMQARWGSHGDYEVIALAPYSVQEMFDLTIEAFNLAEQFRVPVILLSDEILGHMREKVVIKLPSEVKIVNRKKPEVPPEEFEPFKPDDDLVPPMACFGEGYRIHVTGLTHNFKGYPRSTDPKVQEQLVRRLCDKIRVNADRIVRMDEHFISDAKVAVVAYGTPARSAIRAVRIARSKGLKVGLVRLITVWPFPYNYFRELSRRISSFVVAEMNYGQLVGEVERCSGGKPVNFVHKIGGNPHTPEELLAVIEEAYVKC
ncbi:MAG: 2-oxoacid:acceptor oxidoreductase subunit alpha [Candidatus Methanomethylicota archaeon]|nr:MAG: 2-oxoacid:acceptor oxidoreductase subunit alpha [Candidatus Verstraetearchaeota archaeon]